MGFSEILFIMAIALILFGPEDLPDIARAIGRIVFEIRKATNDLTKEFQNAFDDPVNTLNKAFEQTTSSRVVEPETVTVRSEEEEKPQEELLTYEDETLASTEKPSTAKADDPLAELPSDMVSYEEKGASR